MSRLKISPNLFLEVNELNRLVNFIVEDGYKSYLKHLSKSFGIIQNEDNTYFKVAKKTGVDNIITINPGIAFDANLNRIVLNESKDIQIPDINNNYWVIISYDTTNNEEGIVSISSQGVLSGFNTKFNSVLRGQPNFPTKVKFNSSINNGEYEVVDVTSDTEATLSGSFSSERGLKYQVIGTFTPGFQPNDEDKTIYEYDTCKIDLIESEDVPSVLEGQFILAKVSYSDGVMEVDDERLRNLFNYEDTNIIVQNNPFVSLRKTTIQNGKVLDVQFEWGYKIEKFEFINSLNKNIFVITKGGSKFINSNNIPNGILKDWLLVNRKNMISVVIDDNEEDSLYISKFNPSIITNENDEFVIVPNAKEIEIEVSLDKVDESEITIDSNNLLFDEANNVLLGTVDKNNLSVGELNSALINTDDTNYFFKFSIENLASRFNIPVDYGMTLIKLRHRIITNDNTTDFQMFTNSPFENIQGNEEVLGESSFIISINRPEEVQRNYS